MRIAIIGHLRFPISEPFAGGLEAHTFHLATALQNRGHDVVLYARPESGPSFRVHPVAPETFDVGDVVGEQARHRTQLHDAYTYICNHIREGRYDVVHNNSLNYVPTLLAGQLGAPMITSLHTPPFKELIQAHAQTKAFDQTRYAAVSDFTRGQWQEHLPNCEVIHNGINLDGWRYSSRPVPGTVCFIGRLVPEKGVHYAIDAARRAGKHLIIAGPRSDEAYFAKYIEPQLNRSTIRYVGHLSSLETAQLLSNAECSIFSSVWDEPFGLALAEALACGTPVAGFDVGAGREVVGPCGVLVEPRNTKALAGAIHAAARLSRSACRQRARSLFTHEVMVDQFERAYVELLAGLPSGRTAIEPVVQHTHARFAAVTGRKHAA